MRYVKELIILIKLPGNRKKNYLEIELEFFFQNFHENNYFLGSNLYRSRSCPSISTRTLRPRRRRNFDRAQTNYYVTWSNSHRWSQNRRQGWNWCPWTKSLQQRYIFIIAYYIIISTYLKFCWLRKNVMFQNWIDNFRRNNRTSEMSKVIKFVSIWSIFSISTQKSRSFSHFLRFNVFKPDYDYESWTFYTAFFSRNYITIHEKLRISSNLYCYYDLCGFGFRWNFGWNYRRGYSKKKWESQRAFCSISSKFEIFDKKSDLDITISVVYRRAQNYLPPNQLPAYILLISMSDAESMNLWFQPLKVRVKKWL